MFTSTIPAAPQLLSGYHLAPQGHQSATTSYEAALTQQTLPTTQYVQYLPAQHSLPGATNPLIFDQQQAAAAYTFQQPIFMAQHQGPTPGNLMNPPMAQSSAHSLIAAGVPNANTPALFLDYMWNPYLQGANSFACLSSSGYSSLQPSLDGINKLGLSNYGYASAGNIPAYFKNVNGNNNQSRTPTVQLVATSESHEGLEPAELQQQNAIHGNDRSISSIEQEKLKLMESVSSIDASESQPQRRGSKEEELTSSGAALKKPVTYKTNILFKTIPCREYEKLGICPRGKQCQFAHGNEELRLPHTHPLYRTKLCPEFVRGGSCPRGVRCYHAHSVDQLRQYSLTTMINNQYETTNPANGSSTMNQLMASFLTNNSSSANSSFESIRKNGYPPVINPPKYASPLMNA